ncbi:TMEM165/GDT1 family protein [Caloramator sp. mosi_1]|nr:TMEM165/GDT1 family protein [Caloramator sp. mosi_1]WDC85686.1 TMEM165/GDT1 family protein [Caloramator sp. mosi_1]
MLSANSKQKSIIFIGSSLALICSSLVAVVLGDKLSSIIPPQYIQKGAAIAFITIGILLLLEKYKRPNRPFFRIFFLHFLFLTFWNSHYYF